MSDITEEKHAERVLKDEATFFKQFANKIESVFWIMNPMCTEELYLNPAFETLWGRSIEWLKQNPEKWIDTIHPDDQHLVTAEKRIKKFEQHGEVRYEDYYRIVRPDGRILWIKDRSFTIYNDEGKCIGYAGIAEDITKDRDRAQSLQLAKEKAEAANRVKSEFLATMSHELRTPLNAIIGMSQLLLAKDNNTDAKTALELIQSAGSNLLHLINDILDFSKLDAGQLSLHTKPFHLPRILDDIVKSIRFSCIEKNIDIIVNYSHFDFEYLIGDSFRIRQILTNLLHNAIKFTEQGHIQLTVEEQSINNNHVTIQFVIEDTGIGIPKNKINTIFDRFTQVESSYNRQYQGAGLGLSIVKQLVKLMNGTIGVNSQLKIGSTFWVQIELPIDTAKNANPTTAKVKTNKNIINDDKKKKVPEILVIEDNPMNQLVIQRFLAELDITPEIISSGKSFVENPKKYDLILLDISLPEISGIDIAKAVRANTDQQIANMPLIALTAHVLPKDKENCFAAGFNEVLAKPLMMEDLEQLLEKYTG